ncbi:MAG TPA: DUF1015 family protein [Candidatus Limnocylindrales bacterium]|nr:DUF1015 family protein [Candidatus Limnocylindrales bacterium]
MTVVHPIPVAWITTGGTGAQNYDEFADESEITRIIEARPGSALAVEMPHYAPESLGKSFTESLPDAVARLEAAKRDGLYRLERDVVVLYRITRGEAVSYGLWGMVDTDQISTSADEPGLVIRNEDVFLEKVRERVALAEALGHLVSPVLLLQTGRGDELHNAVAKACAEAGPADATDLDAARGTHEIWVKQDAAELLALASGGELVVADGNHRTLAAQTGGLPRFQAVVTTPASVEIKPYNRLVRGVSAALEPAAVGARVRLYTRDGGERMVTLPRDPALGFVDNLDHAVVERELLGRALDLEPGDKRITYVGGDYPESWLKHEVDEGRADLAILIDPVTVPDFIEVNLARQKMPRKSTWFVPKARAGLVVAQL